MIIKFCLITLLVLRSASAVNAQDTAEGSRDKQIRVVLNMSKEQYKTYKTNTKKYDHQLNEVLNNKTLDKSAKGQAMEKILSERKTYQQQQLTELQRKKLFEYEQRNIPVSPRAKQQSELESRLKKRGLKVGLKDSTSKTK